MADDPRVEETYNPGSQSTIFGDYELLDEVARGGMGVVYRVRQVSLDRIVALKLILSGEDAAEEELSRFESEAKSAARLDHPGIVPVYGFGRLEGRPYLAMGFVNGPSLSRRLADNGPLPPQEAAALMQHVAEAIDFAHCQQVIHRDLKPGNVLIDSDGRAQVTDFGLAKRQDAGHSMTATGQVMGTPAYMSPEQAAGEEVGPASDVYSLGATLYAALTGKPPFDAGSIPELLMQVAEEPPVPPSKVNPNVSAALDAICLKCLEKKPGDRYATAGAMAEDLGRFLTGKAIARPKTGRKRYLVTTGAVLAVVTMFLVAMGVFLRPSKDPDQPTQATVPSPTTATAAPLPDASVLTDVEQTLIADLILATNALFSDESKDPWEMQFAASAAVHRQAFQTFGLDLQTANSEELLLRLATRPDALREAVIDGLERWEFMTNNTNPADVSSLRNLQKELDTVDWRRTLRFLREDNNPVAESAYLKDLDTVKLNDSQIDTLALLILSHPVTSTEADVAALKRLRETHPQSFWVNLAMASSFIAQGKAKPAEMGTFAAEAIAPLRGASAARPQTPVPLRQLADAFERVGNIPAARAERDRAAAVTHPAAWAQIELSRQARKAGNCAQAIIAANSACALSPEMMQPRIELLAANLVDGNDPGILEAAKWLVRRIGSEENSMKAIHETILEANPIPIDLELLLDPRAAKARADAWRLVVEAQDSPSANAYDQLCRELDGAGIDATPWSSTAVERFPAHVGLSHLHLFSLAKRATDPQTLIAAGERARSLDPVNVHHYVSAVLAAGYLRAGRFDDAEALFASQLPVNPPENESTTQLHFTPWYQFCAGVYPGLQAKRRLTDLCAASQNMHWQLNLGLLEARIGDMESHQHFQRAFLRETSGKNPFGYCYIAEFLLRAGEIELTQSAAALAVETSPKYFRPWVSLGAVRLRRGDFDGALHASQQARERLPATLTRQSSLERDAAALEATFRAQLFLALGRPQEAADVLGVLHKAWRTENWVSTWAWPVCGGWCGDYARALLASGEVAEAEELCRVQVGILVEDGSIHWAHGLVLLHKGQAKDAATAMERAARFDPLNASIELDWATALATAGETAAALPHLQIAVERAKKGQLRGFRLVEAEAAELALRIANDQSLDEATRRDAQSKAFDWFREHLARWIERANDGDEIELAAVAQQLPKLLICSAATRLRDDAFRNSLSTTHRTAWDDQWNTAETVATEAMAKYLEMSSEAMASQISDPGKTVEVAKWVLSRGGTVLTVDAAESWYEKHVCVSKELPLGAFQIVGVSFSGCSDFIDTDLTRLLGFPMLRDVHLDGTQVTDAGVMWLSRFVPTVGLLNLERTSVTDAAIKGLWGVQRLYLRGTRISDDAVTELMVSQPGRLLIHESTLYPPSTIAASATNPTDYALEVDELSRLDLPLAVSLESGKPATFEAIVVLPAAMFGSKIIVFNGYSDGSSNAYKYLSLMILREGATMNFIKPGSVSARIPLTPKSILPIAVPVHIAGVHDGKQLRIYVNGQLASSINDSSAPTGGRLMFHLSDSLSRGRFRGTLNEVRISSTARYTTDFSPQSRFEPDEFTLALYHCDESEGDVLKDSSGGNHHGKIVGEARWVKAEPYSSPVLREHAVAEWVFTKGGTVLIWQSDKDPLLERQVLSKTDLPVTPFQVVGVSLSNASITDADLVRLHELDDLKYAFLDGTGVTDAGVRRLISASATLSLLSVERTAVTDAVLDALGNLRSVYMRGTQISTAALSKFTAAHVGMEVLPREEAPVSAIPVMEPQSVESFELLFDGQSKVDLPVNRDAALPTTIEAWVRQSPVLTQSLNNLIVGMGKSGDSTPQVLTINLTDHNLFCAEGRTVAGGHLAATSPVRVLAERWTHLAVSFDGNEMHAFSDGKLVAKAALKPTPGGSGLRFTLGSDNGMNFGFAGTIDEVRISTVARYAEDFVPSRRFAPDAETLALYHFDEGEGDIVRDSSGNAHHGTVVGSPKWVPESEIDE